MEITQYIASHREILLIADYAAYRAQLSRQLLAIRKRLNIATPKREKFAPKPITAEQIASNQEYVHLLLLTAERAWAHALYIKTLHSEESTGKRITGTNRTHIISRLSKAAKTARELVQVLKESKVSEQDVVEARAYEATMAGAEEFERQSEGDRKADTEGWEKCLRAYAQARVIYAAYLEKEKKEVFKEVLANTVDPTIRYAAYQARLPRTIAIADVAKRYFPKDDTELVSQVEKIDSYALKDRPVVESEEEEEKPSSVQEVPNSITWRGRKANIVDASIGQALASVTAAEARLKTYIASHPTASTREQAAAYDDVLIASQDAADATKRATDELEKERVDEGDARMQDLRVTSLAVSYDLVSWRVGRNRVLTGEADGLNFEPQRQRKTKRQRKDGKEIPEKEEGRGRKLARLRERTVLYDATIQSIESIKELRGAMRDETFVRELDAKVAYFRALKCVNIAYSHSLLEQHLNSLALLKRASDLLSSASSDAASSTPTGTSTPDSPQTLALPTSAFKQLQSHTTALLTRTHALVELHSLASKAPPQTSIAPAVRRLHDFPPPGTQMDLTNLVAYPPKLEPVPVKPLFLDVAWNYIDYPGRVASESTQAQTTANGTSTSSAMDDVQEDEKPQEKKRGWFGFGR